MLEQSTFRQTTPDSDSVSPHASSAVRALPAQPLFVLEPRKNLFTLGLRDVLAYRELLYFMTWRDLKVRYKQTLLGVAWVVLQPLMMTAVFTVFLSVLARVPSDGAPYPVFAYAGLLPWMFFSSSVATGGGSLVTNAHLLTKIYFPRLILPMAAVAARLVDFVVAFAILGALLGYYRMTPTWNLLALPPLVALAALLALGFATLFAALNVRYRDVGILLPVLVQLWMYVSPVIYPSRLVYDRLGRWGWLYSLNPLVGVLDGFRAALFGTPFPRAALTISAAFAVALFFLAALVFRRSEGSAADLI